MTAEQIALVQGSFARILEARADLAATFYARLFERDPALRPLFRGDLKAQGGKLVAAIATVVRALDRLEEVMDDVAALARRHAVYGVEDRHYAVVGQALLVALEETLGDTFTGETKAAWAAAYGTLSGAMIEAARTIPKAA